MNLKNGLNRWFRTISLNDDYSKCVKGRGGSKSQSGICLDGY